MKIMIIMSSVTNVTHIGLIVILKLHLTVWEQQSALLRTFMPMLLPFHSRCTFFATCLGYRLPVSMCVGKISAFVCAFFSSSLFLVSLFRWLCSCAHADDLPIFKHLPIRKIMYVERIVLSDWRRDEFSNVCLSLSLSFQDWVKNYP